MLKENLSNQDFEDLRGQFFESSISTLNPRRLITLAPTLNKNSDIKTFVSAYCPLSDTPSMQTICGDLVVIRGGSASISQKGLVSGPITGNFSSEIIEVAKKFILDQGLPITTSFNSKELLNLLKENLSLSLIHI